MQRNAQQSEHAGQGGARHWPRTGKDRRCWPSRDGGVLAVVRQQLEESSRCTAWSRAVHGQTQRKDRDAAGRTLAGLGLRSRPTRTVEGTGQGQAGGAPGRVALVDDTLRPRAAPARRVEMSAETVQTARRGWALASRHAPAVPRREVRGEGRSPREPRRGGPALPGLGEVGRSAARSRRAESRAQRSVVEPKSTRAAGRRG